jgi:hypothetical protein
VRRLADGPCTDDTEAACQAEHLEFLQRACAQCKRIRTRDVHPYVAHLRQLNQLRLAGYPLGADELTLREWRDLALVAQELRQTEDARRWAMPAPATSSKSESA